MSGAIAAQLFEAKPGDIGIAPGGDGYHVIRLTDIQPADPTADTEGVARLRAALDQQIGRDLVNEFAAALRSRYDVSVDMNVVERLL